MSGLLCAYEKAGRLDSSVLAAVRKGKREGGREGGREREAQRCGRLLFLAVIRGVLSADEVAAANRSIDAHMDELDEGWEPTQDMLGWPAEERRPFQEMLAHPRIVPYLNEICGRGFRMVRAHHADSSTHRALVQLNRKKPQQCSLIVVCTAIRTGPSPNAAQHD